VGIIGFTLITTVVVLLTLVVGGPSYPWDNPTHFYICGYVGGCLLLSRTSIRLLGRSLRDKTLTEEEIREAIRGWRNTRMFALSGGCLGSLIGLMSNLHAMGGETFGLGLKAAMISLFLGALLGYGFCLPIQYRLEGDLENRSKGERVSEVWPALILAVLVWLARVIIDYITHL
jgi:hypothetical protein